MDRALILVRDLSCVLEFAAKKDVLADLGRLADFLEGHLDMPLARLMASIRGEVDPSELVATYAAELKPLLGKDGFEKVVADLVKDRRLRQKDVVAVAAAMDDELAPSTTKKKVGEHLLALHNSLVTFKAKKRAMAGRSAA